MDAAGLFAIANTAALVSWVMLILFQRRRWAVDVVVPGAVTLFAAAYLVILGARWGRSQGGFGSLDDVATLFADRWLLLAGWLHYLAFDLLVGRWEARDGAARGLSPWLAAPVLVLTFLFGPAGWLTYMVVRRTAKRLSPAAAA